MKWMLTISAGARRVYTPAYDRWDEVYQDLIDPKIQINWTYID